MIKHKAYTLSQQFGFSPDDREDIEQELALYLLEALPDFDPKKGKILTFADRITKHWISKAIRNRSALKRDFRSVVYSLDDLCFSNDGESQRIEDVMSEDEITSDNIALGCIQQVELKTVVEQIMADLPPNLKALCMGLMTETISEYSRTSGISRTTVNSQVKKLRAIFIKAGFENK